MSLRRGERALDALGGVTLGSAELRNPFMTASGTSGHDIELMPYMPLNKLGAVVVKSLFHESWPGNPAPRVHLAQSGMLNAVGLQGPGVHAWIKESLPRLENAKVPAVVSIWGRTIDEYVSAAKQLSSISSRLVALEVNLSCPNLEGRSGIIAHDPSLSGQIISHVSQVLNIPVWAKLSANTDRLVEVATTVVDAGASSLTLVNTMLGMQIDIATGAYSLGNGGGGLSGAAIHPIAVRAVHDVRQALPGVPIVGVGGISTGTDALEMMMAGATAIQVGTATFARPDALWRIACGAALRARSMGYTSWSDVTSLTHRR